MTFDGFELYSNIFYIGAVLLSVLIFELIKSYENTGAYIRRGIKAFVVSIPMALVLGLRSLNVGYDTFMYCHYFYGRLEALPKSEPIFSLLVIWLHNITNGNNYTVMLLFFSFLIVFFSFYAVVLFDHNANLTIFSVCYGCIFFLCATDQFRQLVAVALFGCSVAKWKNDKKISFFVYNIIAFGIHNSVIVPFALFLICLLISNTKSRNVWIKFGDVLTVKTKFNMAAFLFALIVIGATIFFYTHINLLAKLSVLISSSYSKFFTEYLDQQKIGLGLILDILPIIPLLFLRKFLDSKVDRALFYLSFFSIPFRIFGYISYFMYRMMFYPEIVAFILYSYVFKEKNVAKQTKYILIIICIIYFILMYMCLNNHGAYPYELVWNERHLRDY